MLCLDASVVVCIATGEVSDELHELAANWALTGERFIAPNLLGYEFSNSLYKTIKRGADLSAVALAFETFRSMNIELVDCTDIHEEAIALAVNHGMRASYYAHYLVLSARHGVDLYTCDRTLFNSLHRDWPHIRWVPQLNSVP